MYVFFRKMFFVFFFLVAVCQLTNGVNETAFASGKGNAHF
jgi:hypothetical protein